MSEPHRFWLAKPQMPDAEIKKIWVSRYATTDGVVEVEAETVPAQLGYMRLCVDNFVVFLPPADYAFTREGALAQAAIRFAKRRATIQRQLDELNAKEAAL